MGSLSAPTSLTLTQIHQVVGGTLHGNGACVLSSLASLTDATPQALAFIANDQAAKIPGGIKAGALLVHRHYPEVSVPQIVVANPLLAFAQVAQTFFVRPPAPRGVATEITKGAGVQIGADPSIWPFVTLGDRVTIGFNAVVGGDGFGFLPAGKGKVPHRVPHLGTVEIGDDVDIGSCAQVARSRFGRTVVGNGAKIDAMVQVAHNCRVGDGAILSAQVALAGSTVLGDGVLVGGQAGFAGHIDIGPGARIGAGSGVAKDVPA